MRVLFFLISIFVFGAIADKDHNACSSQTEYDFIVVGGGSSGCTIAATLAEKSCVLLLESGLPVGENYNPAVLTADGWPAVVDTPAAIPVQTKEGVWSLIAHTLGGGSALNAGVYLKEQDDWFRQSFGHQFDLDAIHDAYSWVEQIVSPNTNHSSVASPLLRGLESIGELPFNGRQAYSPPGSQTTYSFFTPELPQLNNARLRRTAADFLPSTSNLKVITSATVQQVLFSDHDHGTPQATGVQWLDAVNQKNNSFVKKGGEVIVSAGPFGSPKILLQSGIGPVQDLKAAGIQVVSDLPVGRTLIDRPVIALNIPLDPSKLGGSVPETLLEVRSGDGLEPTSGGLIGSILGLFSLAFVPPPDRFSQLREELQVALSNPSAAPAVEVFFNDAMQIEVLIPQVYSRGWVKLSSNPQIPLDISLNAFSDRRDVSAGIDGVKKLFAWAYSPSISAIAQNRTLLLDILLLLASSLPSDISSSFTINPYTPTITFPSQTFDLTNDTQVEQFLLSAYSTSFHSFATNAAGSVVHPHDCRVKGVPNLRVVDISVFPQATTVNPVGTVMAFARYMGLKINHCLEHDCCEGPHCSSSSDFTYNVAIGCSSAAAVGLLFSTWAVRRRRKRLAAASQAKDAAESSEANSTSVLGAATEGCTPTASHPTSSGPGTEVQDQEGDPVAVQIVDVTAATSKVLNVHGDTPRSLDRIVEMYNQLNAGASSISVK